MRVKIVVIILIGILLFSCTEKSKFQEVSVSEDEIKLSISRFDQELFNADKYNLRELNQKWVADYGLLYESFISQMLREGLPQDPMITYRLEKFLNDSTINLIANEIDKTYGDFSTFEAKFKSAFAYFKHYFPKKKLPKLVTFYSNFNAKTFPFSDTLGIGLDMFIGRDNKVTKMLPTEQFPGYYKADMDPEYLVTEAMKSWIYVNFSRPNEYNNSLNYGLREDFLTTLIYHGKMMLTLEALFPNTPISNLFEYTESEYKWCVENETLLYRNLIEHKLIYSTNQKEIASYINPGNFTPGLPDACPGGVGKWIGYRMVRQYFEENDIQLSDLLKDENDARKILSFYRP